MPMNPNDLQKEIEHLLHHPSRELPKEVYEFGRKALTTAVEAFEPQKARRNS